VRVKVVISGASGLLGRHLTADLVARGHDVVALTRGTGYVDGALNVAWSPLEGVPPSALHGAQVIVNLAGESIGTRRWTTARRAVLRSSRIDPTSACVAALGEAGPVALVNASAVGYYGATEATVDERAPSGTDFLATLCVEWEAAAYVAEVRGFRVAVARFGVVLARDGGALPRMAALARFGVNGKVGSGAQWVSWIHVDDAVAAVREMAVSQMAGPCNVVAPAPVRQRDFSRALGAALHRPSFVRGPKMALRAALGTGAASLVLRGQAVVPTELQRVGFDHAHPNLDGALRDLLVPDVPAEGLA
jgi:uncharacterized protein